MRLGIYGGAFDPPHNAHIALARAAIDQLKLDELRIFPTGQAWHRSNKVSAAADRIAMARIAFDALPKTTVDDRETRRAGPTYTIDTLRELRRDMRPGSHDPQLFLVIGEDQARSFTAWHEWAEIARVAILCIAHRGPPSGELKIPGATIVQLQLPSMPESATAIRSSVARGEDVSSLVPPGIASYIADHQLYRSH